MPYKTWASGNVLNAADLNAMTADAIEDYIDTAEGTTSESYVDLATVGPTCAISMVNGQQALVLWGARMSQSAAGAFGCAMSYAVSGALTQSAGDTIMIDHLIDDEIRLTGFDFITATSTATATVTAKYRRSGASGTATFRHRRMALMKR